MARPRESEPKKSEASSRTTRSPLLYVGSIVILVIVVVTFVGAPVISGIAGSGRLIFGTYDGEEIAWQPGNFLARQYEVISQSLRDAGSELNLEIQLRLAWREAFNRTVLHTAIVERAQAAGMTVSESRVDELIAQDPQFQFNGRFDARAYEAISNQERFTLRTFHRESEMFDRVVSDALSAVRVAESERRFVASMTGPERSFDVVRFSFDEFPTEQVVTYAAENPDLFATTRLSVITVGSLDEAQEVREQAVESTTPFTDLARTFSRDPAADQGGDRGELLGYEIEQELINPDDLSLVLELSEGEISDPVETTSGWAIYRADNDPTPLQIEEEGALDEVRAYMDLYEQGQIQDFVRAEATTFAASAEAAGIDSAASLTDREVIETAFFGINYGNNQLLGSIPSQQIPELADAAFREDFFEQLFALEEGEVSEPIVIRQSAFVFALRDEREAQASDVSFVSEFYESLVGQFQSDEIERAFVDQSRLTDNFTSAFERFVLGNG